MSAILDDNMVNGMDLFTDETEFAIDLTVPASLSDEPEVKPTGGRDARDKKKE